MIRNIYKGYYERVLYLSLLPRNKIEPLTRALSFYPSLKSSTRVTEKHGILICEKIPGWKF